MGYWTDLYVGTGDYGTIYRPLDGYKGVHNREIVDATIQDITPILENVVALHPVTLISFKAEGYYLIAGGHNRLKAISDNPKSHTVHALVLEPDKGDLDPGSVYGELRDIVLNDNENFRRPNTSQKLETVQGQSKWVPAARKMGLEPHFDKAGAKGTPGLKWGAIMSSRYIADKVRGRGDLHQGASATGLQQMDLFLFPETYGISDVGPLVCKGAHWGPSIDGTLKIMDWWVQEVVQPLFRKGASNMALRRYLRGVTITSVLLLLEENPMTHVAIQELPKRILDGDFDKLLPSKAGDLRNTCDTLLEVANRKRHAHKVTIFGRTRV